jgi:ferredoxin
MKKTDKNGLGSIITALREKAYTVIGPVLKDGAVIFDEIVSVNDLPEGWGDRQEAGTYRVFKRNDKALFGYNVGPHSWKKFLFPHKLKLWEADKNNKGFDIKPADGAVPRYAFLGIRSCELNAIFIQDRVFNNGMFTDTAYNKLRKDIFTVAVNCTEAGGTCFCASMNTGPKAEKGFDLALTEVINDSEHYFLLEEGSEKGKEIITLLYAPDASKDDIDTAEKAVKKAAENMGRKMNTDGIKELLYNNHDHPAWSLIAARCLSCANCTMVCPTCFCSNVDDTTDLTGDHTERWRRWDSCFALDYSKVAGGNFRTSIRARYRQWMTHKLASWIDQFGTSGCVGCGRCISWCPVGIDITKEVELIRETAKT